MPSPKARGPDGEGPQAFIDFQVRTMSAPRRGLLSTISLDVFSVFSTRRRSNLTQQNLYLQQQRKSIDITQQEFSTLSTLIFDPRSNNTHRVAVRLQTHSAGSARHGSSDLHGVFGGFPLKLTTIFLLIEVPVI